MCRSGAPRGTPISPADRREPGAGDTPSHGDETRGDLRAGGRRARGCASASGEQISASPEPAQRLRLCHPSQVDASAPPGVFPCHGVRDLADVLHFITGGGGVALVDAVIEDQPTNQPGGWRSVPLARRTILAGRLTNGEVMGVEEHSFEDNDFPPGEYLLVLSPSEKQRGEYFTATGLPGTFVVHGGSAYASAWSLASSAAP